MQTLRKLGGSVWNSQRPLVQRLSALLHLGNYLIHPMLSSPASGGGRSNPNPMSLEILPSFIREHYEIHEWRHACAILKQDFPIELNDLIDVLTRFRLRKSWITVGGGNKSQVSNWIDG